MTLQPFAKYFDHYYFRTLDLIFNCGHWDHVVSFGFVANINLWRHGYIIKSYFFWWEHSQYVFTLIVVVMNSVILCRFLANIISILTIVIISYDILCGVIANITFISFSRGVYCHVNSCGSMFIIDLF